MTTQYLVSPFSPRSFDQHRKFHRQMFDVLQSRNVTINNLMLIFRASDFSNSGKVPINEFVGKIRELDVENKMDYGLVQEMAGKFSAQ